MPWMNEAPKRQINIRLHAGNPCAVYEQHPGLTQAYRTVAGLARNQPRASMILAAVKAACDGHERRLLLTCPTRELCETMKHLLQKHNIPCSENVISSKRIVILSNQRAAACMATKDYAEFTDVFISQALLSAGSVIQTVAPILGRHNVANVHVVVDAGKHTQAAALGICNHLRALSVGLNADVSVQPQADADASDEQAIVQCLISSVDTYRDRIPHGGWRVR